MESVNLAMNENDFPALYEAADNASKKFQKHFFLGLGLNLSLLVIAATLSVVNYPSAWFSIAQAAALLGSLGLVIYLAHVEPQRLWYGTRALSESIKTVTWRFMMRAEPYNNEDHLARQHFLLGLRKILSANSQVCAHAVEMTSSNQITAKMLQVRSHSLKERERIYAEERIDDQYSWYKKKAKENREYSSRWFKGLILVNSLAVALALVKIAIPNEQTWPTDIFVTAAGAMMAWLQTKRFQELATSYALTTHEISLLREQIADSKDEQSFSVFVADSESAFSREHTQWQARRDTD
jgi:hypothetical protein